MYINPPTWTQDRKVEYMDWALQVVDGMRGVHAPLEELFDRTLERARATLDNA